MEPLLRLEIAPEEQAVATLATAGDFCIHGAAARRELASGPGALFHESLIGLFASAAVSTLNLEAPLDAGGGAGRRHGTRLLAGPEAPGALKRAGFDVIGLANNHILDGGAKGLWETRRLCEEAGLSTVGVGSDQEAAGRATHIETKGLRIALLAFAEREFSCARDSRAGAAPLEPLFATAAVRRAREQANFVLVQVHAGNEYYFAPSPRLQSLCRALVEAGADAVLGHHPHAIQGVELYRRAPIVYSLGNLAMEPVRPAPPCWYTGLAARLELGRRGVRTLELYGVRQSHREGRLRVTPLEGEEHAESAKRLERLSEIASAPETLRAFWECFARHRRNAYFSRLAGEAAALPSGAGFLLRVGLREGPASHWAAAAAGLVSRLTVRRERRHEQMTRLLNRLRCPAHHELVLTILEMELEERAPDEAAQEEYRQLIADCCTPPPSGERAG